MGNGLLTFCIHSNTVAVGADVIFSFFDKSINECNVVGSPVPASARAGASGCRPLAIARM